jgi:autonomous glycyl radical cofactor GrcA
MGERREDYCYGKSAYMKADEWVGKSVSTYIEEVVDEKFEQGLKPTLKLRGQEKRLVVNATNFDALAEAFGNNPSKWPGHSILVEGVKVPFKGKRVDSIRVKVRPSKADVENPPFDDDLPENLMA